MIFLLSICFARVYGLIAERATDNQSSNSQLAVHESQSSRAVVVTLCAFIYVL